MYFLLVPLSAYVIQIGGTQFAGPNSVTVTFLNWTIWSLVRLLQPAGLGLAKDQDCSCTAPKAVFWTVGIHSCSFGLHVALALRTRAEYINSTLSHTVGVPYSKCYNRAQA